MDLVIEVEVSEPNDVGLGEVKNWLGIHKTEEQNEEEWEVVVPHDV